jgi:NitT/TauT family transport system substrate-binding protein
MLESDFREKGEDMSRKQASIPFVFVLIFLLVSCSATELPPEAGEEPIHLKVHMSNFISSAPIYIAEQEGYYDEQNLDIEFISVNTSAEAVPLLASGDIDVSGGGLSTGLINVIARDQNIRVVAERGSYDPDGCTYSAFLISSAKINNGEFSNLTDLTGKPIRSTKTGPTAFFVDQVLKTEGLLLSDVEVINMPQSNVGNELGTGGIYAAGIAEPFLTAAVNNGEGEIYLRAEDIIPHAIYGVLAYGPALLEENRDAGNRFMVAYLKGVEKYNEGKTEENLAYFHDLTQLDTEVLENMCLPAITPGGWINFNLGLDSFQNWAMENGHIDATLTEEQFFDDSFINYANQYLEENTP